MGRTKEAKSVITYQEEFLIPFLLDLAVSANPELRHLDPRLAQSFPKLFRSKAGSRLVEDDHLFFRFTDGNLRDAIQACQINFRNSRTGAAGDSHRVHLDLVNLC